MSKRDELRQKYDALHAELGEKFHCSPRIIQLIRTKYSQLPDDSEAKSEDGYMQAIHLIRKEQEAKLVELMKCWRAEKLEFAYLFMKPERGLRADNTRIQVLEKDFPRMLKYIDKVAFRKSAIGFMQRNITEEMATEIIETDIDQGGSE